MVVLKTVARADYSPSVVSRQHPSRSESGRYSCLLNPNEGACDLVEPHVRTSVWLIVVAVAVPPAFAVEIPVVSPRLVVRHSWEVR